MPKYLDEPKFIDQLKAVAAEVRAEFKHVALTDDRHVVAQRFRVRRERLLAEGGAHPQADVAENEIDAVIVDAEHRLAELMWDRQDIGPDPI